MRATAWDNRHARAGVSADHARGGGAMLLTHSHAIANLKDQLLIELTHTPLALAGIAAGWARWLELRLDPRTDAGDPQLPAGSGRRACCSAGCCCWGIARRDALTTNATAKPLRQPPGQHRGAGEEIVHRHRLVADCGCHWRCARRSCPSAPRTPRTRPRHAKPGCPAPASRIPSAAAPLVSAARIAGSTGPPRRAPWRRDGSARRGVARCRR